MSKRAAGGFGARCAALEKLTTSTSSVKSTTSVAPVQPVHQMHPKPSAPPMFFPDSISADGAPVGLSDLDGIEENTAVVLLDTSQSTDGIDYYHDMSEKIVNSTMKSYKSVRIVQWNGKISEMSHAEFVTNVRNRSGRDWTASSLIAQWIIKNKFFKNIIIITDGEVMQSEVDKCNTLLKPYQLDNVHIHIISEHGQLNLSVGCPFTRDNTSSYYVNNKHKYSFISKLPLCDVHFGLMPITLLP